MWLFIEALDLMDSKYPITGIVALRSGKVSGRKCLASIGRVERMAGVDSNSTDDSVSVAREFGAEVRPEGWELLIVGPDECGRPAELRSVSWSLGISEEVAFCEPACREERRAAFDWADLFVLPTYSENFGITVAEAVAWGVPSITETGTPWSFLDTDRCGWWVAPRGDGISSALRSAVATRFEDLEDMGARARAIVESRSSRRLIARQFADLYQLMLGQGAVPSCVAGH